jgi:ribosomal protein S13
MDRRRETWVMFPKNTSLRETPHQLERDLQVTHL